MGARPTTALTHKVATINGITTKRDFRFSKIEKLLKFKTLKITT
jgi:hypothetical protein